MTATTTSIPTTSVAETTTVRVGSRRAPIAFAVAAAAAILLFVVFGRTGDTTFRLSAPTDLVQLPPLVVPARTTTADSSSR